MELRHFVFGRFYHRDSDDDFRVLVSSGNIDKDEAKTIGQYFGGLKDLSEAFNPIYPEVIHKYKDRYCYIRFYPSFNDNLNRPVKPLFHAFIFTLEELAALNFAPWNLDHLFISEFKQDEIIGYDNTVWLAMRGSAKGTTIKPLSYNGAAAKVNGTASKGEFASWNHRWFVQSRTPHQFFDNLSAERKLFFFNQGVLFNYSENLGDQAIKGSKLVFYISDLPDSVATSGEIKSQEDVLNVKPERAPGVERGKTPPPPPPPPPSGQEPVILEPTERPTSASAEQDQKVKKLEQEIRDLKRQLQEETKNNRSIIQELTHSKKMKAGVQIALAICLVLIGTAFGYFILNKGGGGKTVDPKPSAEFKKEKKEMEATIDSLQKEIDSYVETAAMDENKVRTEVTALRSLKTKLNDQIKRLKQDSTGLQANVSRITEKAKSDSTAMQMELKTAKAENTELVADNVDLNSEVNNLEGQKTTLENQKKTLEKERDGFKKEVEELKKQIAAKDKEIVQLKANQKRN